MDQVYSGAYFTIVNAAGSESWSSLPGVMPGTRIVSQPVTHRQDLVWCRAGEWAESLHLEYPATMGEIQVGVHNIHKVISKGHIRGMARWAQFVNQYSQRELTNASDMIRAFQGI
jgi:hypothetical protein